MPCKSRNPLSSPTFPSAPWSPPAACGLVSVWLTARMVHFWGKAAGRRGACSRLMSSSGLTVRAFCSSVRSLQEEQALPSWLEVVGPRTTRWCLAQGIPGDVWKDWWEEGRDLWGQAVGSQLQPLASLRGLVTGVACCRWPPSEGVPSAPCPTAVRSEDGGGSEWELGV